MATSQHPARSSGTSVLVLGAGTLISALGAAAFLLTYQGTGLIGYRTALSAALSVLLLASTLIAFRRDGQKGSPTNRPVLGLLLALGAYPSVLFLMMGTYAVTGALGIRW